MRSGAPKPDVSAPGSLIAAPLSSDSAPRRPFVLSDEIRLNQGTSMAAPFVTGLVALLLERDPALDPDAVKGRLRDAGSIPGLPAGTHDVKWGFGLVDAGDL